MAFQKKQRIAHVDGRPKACKEKLREVKVAELRKEAMSKEGVEARKALKRMNDVVYRGSRSNLKEWFKPTGKGVTCK